MADERESIRLRYTANEINIGLDKAYAAAPQVTTYTKDEVDDLIEDMDVITHNDIDELFN